jgi:hypothetical protein
LCSTLRRTLSPSSPSCRAMRLRAGSCSATYWLVLCAVRLRW